MPALDADLQCVSSQKQMAAYGFNSTVKSFSDRDL